EPATASTPDTGISGWLALGGLFLLGRLRSESLQLHPQPFADDLQILLVRFLQLVEHLRSDTRRRHQWYRVCLSECVVQEGIFVPKNVVECGIVPRTCIERRTVIRGKSSGKSR